MTSNNIYQDIAERTGGAIMLGVVGPVRTGKSTFIKRFMETLVIPNIEDVYMRERAIDELPQSGSGKTIMTAEPKFVPEEAARIEVGDGVGLSVRLVDCVGYMVRGASGQFEDGAERMVTTPWFDHEVTMTEAAESGTARVISDHSTIGIVITTDGSICDIPREDYTEPERRVISELKAIGKPFIVLLNSVAPESEEASELAQSIAAEYDATCKAVNCQALNEKDIGDLMMQILCEFPIEEAAVTLPSWFAALENDCELKERFYAELLSLYSETSKIRDVNAAIAQLQNLEYIESAEAESCDMGCGTVNIRIEFPRSLYYDIISEKSGFTISDDGDLLRLLTELHEVNADYEHIKKALNDVREKGYGVVLPSQNEMNIQEPQIVKEGGRYAVKLKASAPAIHMLKTGIETELSPTIGGDSASEEIISFLLQGVDGDMSRLWESNIFGRSLYDIAEEGIYEKLSNLPDNARAKLQETLQRIINDGSGTLICILL